ncbi:MAG: DUF421 domain-containing protein [Clostridia bacterium]|nr:DUF421 domain-containing protein [Clostridia bacterium]
MVAIFTRTLIVYILLSFSMKIMGKREIGELDVSELVSTLLISEIAAIPIDDPDLPLMNAIIPVIFILSVEILLSYAKTRFNGLKKCIEGEPVFIVYKGEIQQRILRENRISINEFISEMRSQGIGDICEVDYALLEQSGKISVLQKQNTGVSHVLILDGEYNEAEISAERYGRDMIDSELSKRGISRSDVFYMGIDDKNTIKIIKKEEK